MTLELNIAGRWLEISGDNLRLTIVEQATEAAATQVLATPEPAELASLKARVRDLQKEVEADQRTIVSLNGIIDSLKNQVAEVGWNFWNNTVQSDRKHGVTYRVSLYRLANGSVRGTCQCMDFYLNGLGPLNLTYRCKHIQRQIVEAR